MGKSDNISAYAVEFLTGVINATGSPMVVKDVNHKVVVVNDSFCSLLCVTRENLIGTTGFEHFPEQHVKKFIANDQLVFDTGKENVAEETYEDKNGVVSTFITRKSLYTDPNGEKYLIMVLNDITQQKQSEADLRVSERQYHGLFETMSEMFEVVELVYNENGVPTDYIFVDVNSTFTQLRKKNRQEVVGKTATEVLKSAEPYWLQRFGKIIKTGKPITVENYSPDLEKWFEVKAWKANDNQVAILSQDLTEQKQKEKNDALAKKLAEARENYYLTILNNIGDPVFVKDEQSRMVLVNDTFCQLFGYPREQILGKTLAEEVPADEREHFLAIDKQVLDKGKESIVEETITLPGQEIAHISTRKTRFVDHNNNRFLVGVIRDFTFRKNTEDLVRRNAEEYKIVVDSLLLGVVLHGSDSHILNANPKASEILGLTNEQLKGVAAVDPIWKFVYPDETLMKMEDYPANRVIASKKALENYELGIVKPNQDFITWVNVNAAPIFNDNGELEKVVVNFVDVTDTNKALQSLQKSEQRFKLVSEATQEGIWDLDLESSSIYVSPRWREIMGYPDEGDVEFGTSLEEWQASVHPEDFEKVTNALQSHLQDGNEFYVESRHLHQSGKYIWLRSTGKAIYNDQGEPFRMAGSIIDITEEKRREIKLQESEVFFRESQRAASIGSYKLDFASGNWTSSEVLDDILGMDENYPRTIEGWSNLVYEEDREMMNAHFNQDILIERKSFNKEYRICRPSDGTIKWVLGLGQLVTDDNDDLVSMIGTIQDITENKKAAEELDKTYKLFEETSRIAKIGAWEVNLITMEPLFSQQTSAIYELDNIGAVPAIEDGINYYRSDARPIISKAFENAIENHVPYSLELPFITAKGRHIWVKTTGSVDVVGGKAVRILGTIQDITDWKNQQDALERSTKLFKEAGATAKIGGWDLDIASGESYWTEEVYKLYETTPEEFKPNVDDVVNLFLPDSKEAIIQALKNAIEKGVGFDLELEAVTTKGKRIDIRVTCDVILKDGKPARLIGVAQDISERKSREKKLKESELFLKQSQQAASIGSFKYHFVTEEWSSSEVFDTVLGIDKDYPRTANAWQQIVHEDDKEMMQAFWYESVLEKREFFKKEHRIVRPSDGKTRWLLVLGQVHFDDAGNHDYMVGTMQDITEQKRSEKALATSEERFQQVTDASNVWVWETDANGLYRYVSPYIEQILGYTPEEVIGKMHFYDFFSEDIREDLKKLAFEVFDRKEKFNNLENTNVHKDGHKVILETNGFPVLDSKGNVLGYRGADRDITVQKSAEEALATSEERFQQVTDASNVWVWETNADGLYVYASPQIEQILGYTPEEVIGKKHFYDLFAKDVKEDIKKAVFEVFAKKEKVNNQENSNIHKNGSIVILETNGFPVLDSNGELLGYRGADRNVTNQRAAEKALAESEERFQQVTDASNVWVYEIDGYGLYTYVSPQVERVLGYKPEELVGKKHYFDLYPEEERSNLLQRAFELFNNSGVFQNFQNETVRKDGEIVIVESNSFPVTNSKGKITGFRGADRDITTQKAAEQALSTSEKRFQQVIEASNVWVWETDANGLYTYVSPQVERILGYTEDEVIGKKFYFDFFPDEERNELLRQVFERFSNGGAFQNFENRNVRKDGTVAIMESSGFPIIDANGNVLGFRGADRDISARKNAQAEVLRLSQAVEQSPSSIVITNLEGNIEYVNKAFEEVSGYKAQEVLGKNPRIFNSGETSQNEYKGLWQTISKNQTWFGEFHNKKKDGTLYWERASIGPILNSEGEITSFLAIKEDITREKQMEQDLFDTLETLETRVKERTAELEKASKDLELTHKELIGSLYYAKNIQEASIPTEYELQQAFSNSFIIFKPKDIVSGDFYWFYKDQEQGEVIVSLVDCTGHGVPGAMMSMAAFEMLDNVVVSRKIRRPDIVLEDMDEAVVSLLQRKAGVFSVNDGMDMSVVRITPKTKTFAYSGARSGGVFIQKGNVILLKPDRESIGGANEAGFKEFTQQRIDYQQGDRFYLFSDGVYDQFGGPKNKKMYRKTLEELLAETSNLSMQEQKIALEKAFAEWQGDYDQIDDFTLIGIEL